MDTPQEVTTLEELSRAVPSMGPRIRVARRNAGMTTEELAAHLGVLPDSVSAWESDQRTPRANRLQMMAGLLNVSIAWLLEGREDGRIAGDGTPSLEDVRGRLEAARALFNEALMQLEAAEQGLAELTESGD